MTPVIELTKPSSEPTPIKLETLTRIEEVVNEYARKVCGKYRINSEHFSIHLVNELDRGNMQVIPGHVVQIVMLWPDVQPIFNLKIESAFRLMLRLPLRRTMEIVPIAYVSQRGVELRKFYKTNFGDIGEIMPDLIPRQRLRISHEIITTLRDAMTGEIVNVTHKGFEDRFDGNEVGLWLKLSRKVRDMHPEPIIESIIESESKISLLNAEAS